MKRAALAALLIAGACACAAEPAPSAPGLQFDQLRLFVFEVEPLPPPEAFEEHYAAALQRPPEEVATNELAARTSRLAEMTAGKLEQQLRGLLSGALSGLFAAHPIAGAIGSRVLDRAFRALDDARLEARAAGDAQAASQRLRRTLNARALVRVSVAGEQLRIDHPAEGSAVIAVPSERRYAVLDTRARTYRLLQAPPEPPTPADAICGSPAPASQPLGRRDINGVAADGFVDDDQAANEAAAGEAAAGGASGNDASNARFVTTYYLSDIRLPLALLGLLDGAEACADDPMADRLMVYTATRRVRAAASTADDFDIVLWRGHLRTLDDPARFTIPDDYRALR